MDESELRAFSRLKDGMSIDENEVPNFEQDIKQLTNNVEVKGSTIDERLDRIEGSIAGLGEMTLSRRPQVNKKGDKINIAVVVLVLAVFFLGVYFGSEFSKREIVEVNLGNSSAITLSSIVDNPGKALALTAEKFENAYFPLSSTNQIIEESKFIKLENEELVLGNNDLENVNYKQEVKI